MPSCSGPGYLFSLEPRAAVPVPPAGLGEMVIRSPVLRSYEGTKWGNFSVSRWHCIEDAKAAIPKAVPASGDGLPSFALFAASPESAPPPGDRVPSHCAAPAYLVGFYRVTDAKQYAKYQARLVATNLGGHFGMVIEAGGSEPLVTVGAPWPEDTAINLTRWPCLAAWEGFFLGNEYQSAVLPLRANAATYRLNLFRTEPQTAQVTQQRLTRADAEPGQWLGYGRDYLEQHFSPLKQISTANVAKLGLAWWFDIPEREPTEATPIVADNVMYVSSGWSRVFALDARTGREIWTYDPKVDRSWLVNACCNAVNRGVAVWQGKVYVGTLDGRLLSLDARSGRLLWEVQTFDRTKPYAITGAPRVARGLVFIGNGGADMGVRGYVTAYDANTGRQAWRFYTVPGNPADGFENPAMEMASKTWSGEWWKYGGGGTVWDAITYDPELDLLYVGTGNGAPWNHKVRSPDGGDNLFLASIVALRPTTGEYVWHYQANPGETWDYGSTSPIVLATLPIDGKPRKVLMQAPKNGFFYVIDRETGKLISAKAHAMVDWASRIDVASGRPVERPEARFPDGKPVVVYPGQAGAGNWQAMSFDAARSIVYMQSRDTSGVYVDEPGFRLRTRTTNTAVPLGPDSPGLKHPWPSDPGRFDVSLVAWDPVKQADVWRVRVPPSRGAGALATSGGLVFHGRGNGELKAYEAASGKELWSFDAQNPIVAAPVSFSLAGEQYVALTVGWGYGGLVKDPVPHPATLPNTNRVLVFKLGASRALPAVNYVPEPLRRPPAESIPDSAVDQGRPLYQQYCGVCHGFNAAGNRTRPDLRYSPFLDNGAWDLVLLEGALAPNGMASFKGELTREQVQAIRAYVIRQAQRAGTPAITTKPVQ